MKEIRRFSPNITSQKFLQNLMRFQIMNAMVGIFLIATIFILTEWFVVLVQSNQLSRLENEIKMFKNKVEHLSGKDAETKKIEFQRDIINFEKERFNITNNIWGSRFQLLSILFFGATFVFTWRNYSLSKEKQFVEALNEAVNKIGDESLQNRIGGIYLLERLARFPDKDFQQMVMEILTTYVQEKRSLVPYRSEDLRNPLLEPMSHDVKAALKVIARNRPYIGNHEKVNLEQCDLKNISISKANFRESILVRTNFEGANLVSGNFMDSDLSNASFHKADLTKSNFSNATLNEVDFTDAILNEVNLKGVDLSRATGLTQEQIKSARTNNKTTFSPNLLQEIEMNKSIL